MRPSPEGAVPVVIDPCVFARELARPKDRPVCLAWRDRMIVPVVTRRILNHTLGFLRKLGLTRELLRLWALWLTHKETAMVLTSCPPSDSIVEEYAIACGQAGEGGLVVTDYPRDFDRPGIHVRAVGPLDLLAVLEKARNRRPADE